MLCLQPARASGLHISAFPVHLYFIYSKTYPSKIPSKQTIKQAKQAANEPSIQGNNPSTNPPLHQPTNNNRQATGVITWAQTSFVPLGMDCWKASRTMRGPGIKVNNSVSTFR